MNAVKPRVFSGIQATGVPTLGNYLGAMRNWVRDQDRYDNIFCVVDLHALTVLDNAKDLSEHTWAQAASLLAAGIDPQKSLLFLQSHVPEHTTLCWILNAVTPTGWLNRMTQFKSKAGSERESASTALYDYPVLMAADILAYHTDYVPVGEDQKQHVELTRDAAERFNYLFGETFTIPEVLIPEVGARIMALDDPTKKMSKSEPSGAVYVLDSPDTIRKKIGRAVTDSLGIVRFSPDQPGLYNLLTIIRALSGEKEEQIVERFAGQGYRAVKEEAAERVIEALAPLQERYREFEQEPEIVDRILLEGAERAQPMAYEVVSEVERRVGLRPSLARQETPSAAV